MNKLTIILTAACMTFFALQTQAQDTIRLTWKGSTNKKIIKVRATAGTGNIIVDWGKGTPQSYNGGGDDMDVTLSYTYGDINTYNVIIAVPANTALTYLSCSYTQLTALDLSNNTALTDLRCYSNQLTALDVSNNTALTDLRCYSNQLTALDLSNNTALTYLECYSNQLTALDVSNNTALTYLECYKNQLTALDVSNNTALTHLNCYNNQLTILDISNNTALTSLLCYSNQLTALDVSNNTALTQLWCFNNQLTSLDLSNNTALRNLHCSNNQLTALDVSNNTALTELSCYNTQLTDLDIANNTALTVLTCSNTQLTALDISNNTALTQLDCSNTQLTALDISNNTALTWLHCYNNQLPLSQLYPLWNNKGIIYEKIVTPQDIYDTIEVSKTIDLSSELEFGSPAVPTQFTITMRDNSSAEGNYTFENGELIFTASGDYKVVMQNDSVRSGTTAEGDVVTVTAYYHVWEIGANANLASLTVSEGTLTPAFAPTTTSYSVDVANSITNITLTAQAKDPKATVSGDTGTHSLQIGENPFTITVTAEDNTTIQSYIVKVNRSSVGIEEIENNNSISIYPNPTKGELQVTSSKLQVEQVDIYDISGRTIGADLRVCPENTIDISHLSNGIYLLKVKTTEGETVRKIVKE